MQLQTETDYFEAHRGQWIAEGHEGEWCVILGERLLSFYPDLVSAYSAGVEEFGEDTAFLVKEVLPQEPVEIIQRVDWRNKRASRLAR